MKNLLMLFFALLLFTGCATFATINPVLQTPEHKKSTSFQIGQDQQANLGEPMVTEEDLFFYNGLITTSDYQPPAQSGVPLIKEGTMLKLYGSLGNGDKVYQMINVERAKDLYGKPVSWDYCVAVNSSGHGYGITVCTMDYVVKWPAPVNFLKEAKVYERGSNKQELIYNGKSKDTIKLSYREFMDDLARPAFTQDLSYDLSESKIIGFKKMKIEIIETTNSYIKFRVHSSMN